MEEVLGERIETQEGGTLNVMALRDDDRDTMSGVGDGGGRYE